MQAIAGSPDAVLPRCSVAPSKPPSSTAHSSTGLNKRDSRLSLSVKETSESVRIPITGLSTTQQDRKEPDEIVRVLCGLRSAILFLQSQREIGVGLLEKLLKLDLLPLKDSILFTATNLILT